MLRGLLVTHTAFRRNRGSRAAVVAMLGGVVIAAGQPSSQPPPTPVEGGQPTESTGQIVVIGTRLRPEEVRARAAEFVRLTGAATAQRQAARWRILVCPRVIGVAAAYARDVEANLRRIALAAGVPVAPTRCRTNVTISFVANAEALVRTVAERAPRQLSEVSRPARAELLTGSAPIRWWYTTGERNRDGTDAIGMDAPFAGMDGPGGIPSSGNSTTMVHHNSSMISTFAVRTLTSASVVIDMTRAEGVPLDAVAAFAAMVAFAEIRPSVPPPANSILGLFGTAGGAPTALTDWDLAFLRALYRLPLDRAGRQHRAMLARGLADAVLADGDRPRR